VEIITVIILARHIVTMGTYTDQEPVTIKDVLEVHAIHILIPNSNYIRIVQETRPAVMVNA
jgi:hypothetical protein